MRPKGQRPEDTALTRADEASARIEAKVKRMEATYLAKAQSLANATGMAIQVWRSRPDLTGTVFRIRVGGTHSLVARLVENRWEVTTHARRDNSSFCYSTDQEFENAQEQLLEPIIGSALEVLLRGQPAPLPMSVSSGPKVKASLVATFWQKIQDALSGLFVVPQRSAKIEVSVAEPRATGTRLSHVRQRPEVDTAQLRKAQKQLDAEKARQEETQRQLQEGIVRLHRAQQELEVEKAQRSAAQRELEEREARLSDGQRLWQEETVRLRTAQQELEVEKARRAAAQRELEEREARLSEGQRRLETEKARLTEAQRRLQEETVRLCTAQRELEAGKAQREFEAEKAGATEAQRQLETENARLTTAQQELAEREARLSGGQRRLETENARLIEAQRQLQEEIVGLHTAQQELERAKAQRFAAQRELEEREARLSEGQQQLETKNARLTEAHRQVQEEIIQLRTAQRELEAEKAQRAAAQRELAEREARLSEGQRQLETENARLADIQRRIQDGYRQPGEALRRLPEAQRAGLLDTKIQDEARGPWRSSLKVLAGLLARFGRSKLATAWAAPILLVGERTKLDPYPNVQQNGPLRNEPEEAEEVIRERLKYIKELSELAKEHAQTVPMSSWKRERSTIVKSQPEVASTPRRRQGGETSVRHSSSQPLSAPHRGDT